jgi:hypothetical protein
LSRPGRVERSWSWRELWAESERVGACSESERVRRGMPPRCALPSILSLTHLRASPAGAGSGMGMAVASGGMLAPFLRERRGRGFLVGGRGRKECDIPVVPHSRSPRSRVARVRKQKKKKKKRAPNARTNTHTLSLTHTHTHTHTHTQPMSTPGLARPSAGGSGASGPGPAKKMVIKPLRGVCLGRSVSSPSSFRGRGVAVPPLVTLHTAMRVDGSSSGLVSPAPADSWGVCERATKADPFSPIFLSPPPSQARPPRNL